MLTPEPNKRYLMPVQFGPHPQLDEDQTPEENRLYPKRRTAFVHYLTRREQLQKILPPGFEVYGEPVISFEMTHHTEFQKFGGRGYGIFAVNYPAIWHGNETVVGMFRSVTFEDLPDAIIMGREDLGCHKLHADFPEPRVLGRNYYYQAGYYGQPFFEMELRNLMEVTDTPPIDMPFTGPAKIAGRNNEGLLFYKYIPRINQPGIADVEHAVLMGSSTNRHLTVEKHYVAEGSAFFEKIDSEDAPTYFHVVNGLAELDLLESRGATLTFTRGKMELPEMRALS